VILTSVPAASDAGGPEFAVDNVAVTLVPEPAMLCIVFLAVVAGLASAMRHADGEHDTDLSLPNHHGRPD
jgi:hypothetical protein